MGNMNWMKQHAQGFFSTLVMTAFTAGHSSPNDIALQWNLPGIFSVVPGRCADHSFLLQRKTPEWFVTSISSFIVFPFPQLNNMNQF